MNLEMSRRVARKIRRQPALFRHAVETMERWKRLRKPTPPALKEWDRILHRNSPDQVLDILTQDNEEGNRLRQSDPFAGVVTQQERMRIYKKYAES